MMVNPMERYSKLEGQAAQKCFLNRAKKLDPENPRITIMEKPKIYISLQNSSEAKPKAVNFLKFQNTK